MVYDPGDLRSQLSSDATKAASTTRPAGANVAPQYVEFGRVAPTERSAAGSELWWTRSQSCVVNYVRAVAGEVLERAGQPDEYVVLLPDAATAASFTAHDGAGVASEVTAVGPALVVVPPGTSTVRAEQATELIRLFTTESTDLCQRCANDGFYRRPDPNVAPYAPWPEPSDGYRLRIYRLDEVAADPNRFGRIFRCSTFMVNYFYADPGPRDPAKLSPHHHDDFEQLSLQLAGDYVHHIRTPWTADLAARRDDEHRRCTSPAVTVIPPPSLHTSQGVGDTVHQLIDIFCPPRADFSARPGWVLNAAEYPTPAR